MIRIAFALITRGGGFLQQTFKNCVALATGQTIFDFFGKLAGTDDLHFGSRSVSGCLLPYLLSVKQFRTGHPEFFDGVQRVQQIGSLELAPI